MVAGRRVHLGERHTSAARVVPVGHGARVTAPRRAAPAEASRPAMVCVSVVIVTSPERVVPRPATRVQASHHAGSGRVNCIIPTFLRPLGCRAMTSWWRAPIRPGVRGAPPGATGRREPSRAAPPRRRRSVPAGPLRRRHRGRGAAGCRGLGRAQDGHRGGGLPSLPGAAGAGDLVLGHREPLGRAAHRDRRRARRGRRGGDHVGPLRRGHRAGRAASPLASTRSTERRRADAASRLGSTTPIRRTARSSVLLAAALQRLRRARSRQQRRLLADRRGGAAARRDLRAPLRAEVQHRIAIERGATVEVLALDGADGLDLWVRPTAPSPPPPRVQPLALASAGQSTRW